MRWRRAGAMVLGSLAALAACASGTPAASSRSPEAGVAPAAAAVATTTVTTSAFASLLASTAGDRWLTTGTDPWEVWVCHVPADSTAATYGGLGLRLPLTPAGVAGVLGAHVTPYFDGLSHGLYHPVFRAGGEHTMAAADEPQSCLDAAVAGASPGTRGVIAVADAEHAADQPGGFGKAGEPCAQPPCTEQQTGRGAYVGAADFHPDWGDRPPMDLVEHEIGHALGWPHSGVVDGATEEYRSGLDVMSDSAEPRTVDPDRRDAADTLAVDRLAAGWLPPADVAVVPAAGAAVVLAPSTGATGTRAVIVDIDDRTLLTVELLPATGDDSHLPASGIAVHRIVLATATAAGAARSQQPLVGTPPYTDLLRAGGSIDADGWHIAVQSADAQAAHVTVTPVAGTATATG